MSTNPPSEPQSPDTPPRRNWHLARWFLVLAIAVFGWSGWRAYAFRATIAEAKALGWTVKYTDPVEEIRQNWKSAFKKSTWLDGVTSLDIPKGDAFEENVTVTHRLNPQRLQIRKAPTLRDLAALKPLTRLQVVVLNSCTELTNADALENLAFLQMVSIEGATGLLNLDALKSLTSLQTVNLIGCTGLTNLDGLKNLSALQVLGLYDAKVINNVDALKNLSALKVLLLDGCSRLTNLDALGNISALQTVSLKGCWGLTNVDALKNLTSLKSVELKGCTRLTPESVVALRQALPKTRITGP
jgi:hypothetical protein